MAAFAGLRTTGDFAPDQRPKNFREYILWANPNGSAPLTALLARARKEKTDDPQFYWWEQTQGLIRTSVSYSTGYLSSDTTLTLSGGGLDFVPGDTIQVEKTESAIYDNELMMVSAVTSDTVIVVRRGIAGSVAGAIADGTYLTRIGSAYGDGTGAPPISSRNPTKVTNYTQIFKQSVGISRTTMQTRSRTGDTYANDKKWQAFKHATGMELAFMFGMPYEETIDGSIVRHTGGLRSLITTHSSIFTTSPTEDTFIEAVYKVYDNSVGRSGDERLVLCGNGFLMNLNKVVRNSGNTQIRYDGPFKVYGMNLQRWILPMGTLGIKSHPLMNNHPRYQNSAFILDMGSLVYRPLQDTIFKDNVQTKKSDTREGLWLTEAGLEVDHEEVNGYIGNFVV